jgi:hypothetical protein
MELMLLRLFEREVERHCRYLLVAAHAMQNALAAQDVGGFFMAAQTFVTAGANISKALWGSGGSRTEHRAPLRRSLGVDDNSCLRPTRFRNHLEHYDERLETWWKTSANHNIAEDNIMPAGAIVGIEPSETFRGFDPTTGELTFWGERLSVPTIVAEAKRIHAIAAVEAAKPHWEP